MFFMDDQCYRLVIALHTMYNMDALDTNSRCEPVNICIWAYSAQPVNTKGKNPQPVWPRAQHLAVLIGSNAI